MRPLKLSAMLSAMAVCLALSPQARANLIININGSQVATQAANTSLTFTSAAPINGFNVNSITMAGVDSFGGSGELVDNSSLNISSTGSGSLTILLTETNLSLVGAAANFNSLFSALINNASVTRSFYVDPLNGGLLTDLLGSTTAANASFTQNVSLSGPFSLTEKILITATGAGAKLSADDSVNVPEPASLALLGVGILGLGFVAGRKRSV
jgi:hypothetical protein